MIEFKIYQLQFIAPFRMFFNTMQFKKTSNIDFTFLSLSEH